ncbi:MAG TPA: HIT family protein [Alphaproteobacteria bacterium]|jgi:diadenosine tetraphosphate (Ap4A) HIT family hydrolase|nr:HIT family protein [Alphaproteobacteria bacterium]
MTDAFALDPQLERDTLPICDLALSAVRLMNDSRYPWLILVPRRANVSEVIDLTSNDQHLLLDETSRVAEALRTACTPKKLNIAAIGNIVAQLHVHVVARFADDGAWPQPVWGVGTAVPYGDAAATAFIDTITRALGQR